MAAEFCSVILSALDSSVAGGTAAMEVISRVLTSPGLGAGHRRRP